MVVKTALTFENYRTLNFELNIAENVNNSFFLY